MSSIQGYHTPQRAVYIRESQHLRQSAGRITKDPWIEIVGHPMGARQDLYDVTTAGPECPYALVSNDISTCLEGSIEQKNKHKRENIARQITIS